MNEVVYGNFSPQEMLGLQGLWWFKPALKLFVGRIEGHISAVSCYGTIVEFHPTGRRKEWVLVADMSLLSRVDTPEGD